MRLRVIRTLTDHTVLNNTFLLAFCDIWWVFLRLQILLTFPSSLIRLCFQCITTGNIITTNKWWSLLSLCFKMNNFLLWWLYYVMLLSLILMLRLWLWLLGWWLFLKWWYFWCLMFRLWLLFIDWRFVFEMVCRRNLIVFMLMMIRIY